jgi:glutathionyl-hydroquinone reductase
MDYTHILCIKVWSNAGKFVTNYNSIDNKIKDLIADNEFTETVELDGIKHTISITWVKQIWDEKMNNLITGELVANIQYSDAFDQVIYKHTELVLKKIQDKLEESNAFDSKWEIIFNIVKPLSKTKLNIDQGELWRY